MAHHHHAHGDGYYLDQLCLVALSAAFGGICLSLCIWQSSMLHLMLAPFLHGYVLAGGILLLAAAFIRAGMLWRESAKETEHDHQHCNRGPECAHDHHDHDWAPWRYVVMLVPIILFLLGLPNKLPELRADDITVDTTQEALDFAGLCAMSDQPLTSIIAAAVLHAEAAEETAPTVKVSSLEQAARSEAAREQWQGELVRVEGVVQPGRIPRQFQILRYVRYCCSGDARPTSVAVLTRSPTPTYPREQWLAVTGRVGFRNSSSGIVTVLEATTRNAVVPTLPQNIMED